MTREGLFNGVTFVVVDVETTGLYPDRGDRVCELAAIKFDFDGERGRLQTLINPEKPIPPFSTGIHGISDAMVAGAPRFADVADAFQRLIGGTVLLAQNASFDLGFLKSEFTRANRMLQVDRVLDTIGLAKADKGLPNYKLATLAKAYGIPVKEAHRSEADCDVTMQIFLRAADSLVRDGKVKGLADLERLGRPFP